MVKYRKIYLTNRVYHEKIFLEEDFEYFTDMSIMLKSIEDYVLGKN